MQRGAAIAAGDRIAVLNQHALRGHDRAGDDLVAARDLRSDRLRRRPGDAVVGAGAQQQSESRPAFAAVRSHAVEVIDRPLAVVKDAGPVHVAVGDLEELAGRVPRLLARTQAGWPARSTRCPSPPTVEYQMASRSPLRSQVIEGWWLCLMKRLAGVRRRPARRESDLRNTARSGSGPPDQSFGCCDTSLAQRGGVASGSGFAATTRPSTSSTWKRR